MKKLKPKPNKIPQPPNTSKKTQRGHDLVNKDRQGDANVLKKVAREASCEKNENNCAKKCYVDSDKATSGGTCNPSIWNEEKEKKVKLFGQ